MLYSSSIYSDHHASYLRPPLQLGMNTRPQKQTIVTPRPPPDTDTKTQPLATTQPTNNGHTMPKLLIHVFGSHRRSTHTPYFL